MDDHEITKGDLIGIEVHDMEQINGTVTGFNGENIKVEIEVPRAAVFYNPNGFRAAGDREPGNG
jgi:hypothetical protein